jgi:HAD superfamily hydrolase (TIGR01459 family)
VNPLKTLDDRYRVILCDVWGVIHNGVELYPGAAERLQEWREQGRFVILLTNAPRTADAVRDQLGRIGLTPDKWDAIATSGEAGIAALKALAEPVGFLGTASDRSVLEKAGVRFAGERDFADLACTGLTETRPRADDYRNDLAKLAERNVRFHCLNPDRVVVRGGVNEPCAGALADLYEELGGTVAWYGKPHRAIYEHALRLADHPPIDQVLAVGDGLQTDILGAARMGLDTVFVTGGIHAGEPFPDDFSANNDLGDWKPVLIVEGMA